MRNGSFIIKIKVGYSFFNFKNSMLLTHFAYPRQIKPLHLDLHHTSAIIEQILILLVLNSQQNAKESNQIYRQSSHRPHDPTKFVKFPMNFLELQSLAESDTAHYRLAHRFVSILDQLYALMLIIILKPFHIECKEHLESFLHDSYLLVENPKIRTTKIWLKFTEQWF